MANRICRTRVHHGGRIYKHRTKTRWGIWRGHIMSAIYVRHWCRPNISLWGFTSERSSPYSNACFPSAPQWNQVLECFVREGGDDNIVSFAFFATLTWCHGGKRYKTALKEEEEAWKGKILRCIYGKWTAHLKAKQQLWSYCHRDIYIVCSYLTAN